MSGVVEAVEDYSDVGEEFAYYVECAWIWMLVWGNYMLGAVFLTRGNSEEVEDC